MALVRGKIQIRTIYHLPYAGCSGMKNPSKIKKADAVSKGYTACKKCY